MSYGVAPFHGTLTVSVVFLKQFKNGYYTHSFLYLGLTYLDILGNSNKENPIQYWLIRIDRYVDFESCKACIFGVVGITEAPTAQDFSSAAED